MPTTTPTAAAPYDLQQAEDDIATLQGQLSLLEEIVYLLVNSAPQPPNTLSDRIQMYAQTSGTPAWLDANGLQMGAIGAQTAQTNLNNTATGGAVTMATWTIPANVCVAGSIFELEVWGYGSNGNSNNSQSYQVVAAGNGMSNFTLASAFFPANQIFRWHITSRIICWSSGSSGIFQSQIFGEVSEFGGSIDPGSGSQNSSGMCGSESTGTTTIDTTSPITLALAASWGGSSSGQAITSTNAIPKRIC